MLEQLARVALVLDRVWLWGLAAITIEFVLHLRPCPQLLC